MALKEDRPLFRTYRKYAYGSQLTSIHPPWLQEGTQCLVSLKEQEQISGHASLVAGLVGRLESLESDSWVQI